MTMRDARTVSVAVTSIDSEGMAVGSLDDGRRVHVKGVGLAAAAAPASVSVQIVKRRRREAFGIAAPQSRGESAAVCRAYPRCGGCAMQHLDSAAQLGLKRGRLERLLEGHGVAPDLPVTTVSGPQFYYRRRARLGVRHLPDRGETLVGFRESFGSRVARIDACLVLVEPLAAALPTIQRTLATLEVRARVPQVELAAGDDAGALVVRHLDPLSALDRERLLALEASTGHSVWTQAAGLESVTPLRGRTDDRLRYRLDRFGVVLEFAPTDFIQVNGEQNRELVATAVDLLAPARGERVVDLFCGIGNFTLPLARAGANAIGIDGTAELVAQARRNADANGLGARVEVVAADLHRALTVEVAARISEADAALVDPPRSGLGALAGALAAARLSRIVYASCEAMSFAADAAELVSAGFRMKRLIVLDVFPHTAHVETLALFERR